MVLGASSVQVGGLQVAVLAATALNAWVATPDRDRLTASSVHQAVDYRSITRYEVAGGYVNVTALAKEAEA